jgi:hypothetical protein
MASSSVLNRGTSYTAERMSASTCYIRVQATSFGHTLQMIYNDVC